LGHPPRHGLRKGRENRNHLDFGDGYSRIVRTRILPEFFHRIDNVVHNWTKSEPAFDEGFSDRSIERPFVYSNLPADGEILDLGCSGSDLPVVLTCLGFHVVGLDARPFHQARPPFQFVRSDIRRMPFADDTFDVVTAVSTIEHVGLSGRYDSDEDPFGDRRAMEEVFRVVKRGGDVLLTVPYGQSAIFRPWHRVYGADQLRDLVKPFTTRKASFFMPDETGMFRKVEQGRASTFEASAEMKRGGVLDYSYALACLALRRM
jgi:SAM-dependent methyltransferase